MTYPANTPLPDDEPVEYEAVLVDGGHSFWVLVTVFLIGLFWTAGAVGGVWYLCSRIDQAMSDSASEASR